MIDSSFSSKSVRFTASEIPREGRNLVQVIYHSTMRDKEHGPADFKAILTSSHHNNARSGITGLLLYHDGNVLQFLEGEDGAVEETYSRIRLDTRHCGLLQIVKRAIVRRDFGNWRMGFKELSEGDRCALEGYSELVGTVTTHLSSGSSGSSIRSGDAVVDEDMSLPVRRLILSYQKLYHDDDMTPLQERPSSSSSSSPSSASSSPAQSTDNLHGTRRVSGGVTV